MPNRPSPLDEAARAQLPPDVLADAHQDRVHEELPGVRAAKSARVPTLDRTGINYGCSDSLMAVFGMRRVDE